MFCRANMFKCIMHYAISVSNSNRPSYWQIPYNIIEFMLGMFPLKFVVANFDMFIQSKRFPIMSYLRPMNYDVYVNKIIVDERFTFSS